MKFRQLLFLTAAFLVLLGLVLFQNAAAKRRTQEHSAESAKTALGAAFSPAFISKIEIGRKETGERIGLEKGADGAWTLTGEKGGPARTDAVESFMKPLTSLYGEIRSESAEVLGDYQLGEDQAYKIVLSGSEGKSAVEILVSPLRPRGTQNFIRAGQSSTVLETDTDLLAGLGIFSKEDRLNNRTFADLKPPTVESR